MLEYRDIEGFPGYRVDSDGTVWSCRKQVSEKGHRGFKTVFRTDALPVSVHKIYGYCYVTLTNGAKRQHKRVHVIVLESFVGPRPKGMQSRHHNGIRSDNRLVNLSWATPKENNADKIAHGTRQCGLNAPRHKLVPSQVREILALRGVAGSRALARRFGVSRGAITGIWYGKNWKHTAEAQKAVKETVEVENA